MFRTKGNTCNMARPSHGHSPITTLGAKLVKKLLFSFVFLLDLQIQPKKEIQLDTWIHALMDHAHVQVQHCCWIDSTSWLTPSVGPPANYPIFQLTTRVFSPSPQPPHVLPSWLYSVPNYIILKPWHTRY